jgi:glycolate oxidase
MTATTLDQTRESLVRIVGEKNVSRDFFEISKSCLDEVSRRVFDLDKTADHIVARPTDISQVQGVIKYAAERNIPVFVRGSGTGYFGGEVPTSVGIVIETTALTKVVELDRKGGYVTCQTGLKVEKLNDYLKKRGFWWTHVPGSRKWATVGGTVSALGGGPFASRFGYAPDTVASMSVVTPDGELVRLGLGKVKHDMSSLRMSDLFASAEGTLGVVVQVTLKIFPLPESRQVGLYAFPRLQDAVATCYDILNSGVYPECIEIEDRNRFLIEGLAPLIDLKSPRVKALGIGGAGAFMVVSHSGSSDVTRFSQKATAGIVQRNKGRVLKDKKIIDLYWKSKTEITSWLSKETGKLKVHTCLPSVPLYRIPDLAKFSGGLITKASKVSAVGTGYFVIMPSMECSSSIRMMFDDKDPEAVKEYESIAREVAQKVLSLDGTPASTFGVGSLLVGEVDALGPRERVALARKIKHAIDPKGILNQGKKSAF